MHSNWYPCVQKSAKQMVMSPNFYLELSEIILRISPNILGGPSEFLSKIMTQIPRDFSTAILPRIIRSIAICTLIRPACWQALYVPYNSPVSPKRRIIGLVVTWDIHIYSSPDILSQIFTTNYPKNLIRNSTST